ncbi:MAG: pyridoxamine 5'-phosphate oxidase family protein [Candidatus Schekmanbacteria bacterium]|nr:pyridoxamine 5'-phosphate oxidase family protein [Candidatus Schekmanbacteria bacterium]
MTRLRWLLVIVLCGSLGFYSAGLFAADEKPGAASAASAPAETKVKPAAIKATDKKIPNHPNVEISMTCSECHEVQYDAESTATKTWINNYAQMPKDALWKKISDFLPNRQRFVMATVGEKDGKYYPTATTADFTLVPDEHIFICSNEKGTEKMTELTKNSLVSMVHYEGSIEGPTPPSVRWWKSVQVFGKATPYEPGTAEFSDLAKKYVFYRVTPDRALKRMIMTRIDVERIIYFDSSLMKEGFSPYQLWEK